MGTNTPLLACIIVITMAFNSQGLQLSIDRNLNSSACGSLMCSYNIESKGFVSKIRCITISKVTDTGIKTKLVYVSESGTNIYDKTTTAVYGRITNNHAFLSVDFQTKEDCLSGIFQCDLVFADVAGQVYSTCKKVVPESYHGDMDCLVETSISATTQVIGQEPATTQQPNREIPVWRGMDHDVPRKKILLWGKVEALCDTETDEGGWVIIQRRTKGDVDFCKLWADYKKGFGTPDTDYWLGLDTIHILTSKGYTQLRVDMEYQGKKYYAIYSNFNVADEASKYKLTVGNYNGTAGDSLTYHNGMYFSTMDRDNDASLTESCIDDRKGAWWYNDCHLSDLNGIWAASDYTGLNWQGVAYPGSVDLSEMKVRYA